jgi:hypothetical protein
MLIVMKNWDFHGLAQRLFDLETVGRLNVLEVDATKGGFKQLAEFNNLLGIVAVDLDIKNVDIGKAFEKDGLAFHNGFAGESSYIAQTENCSSVAEDGNQIPAAGIFKRVLRILLDSQTRHSYAGRVRQAKIALRAAGLGRYDFDLSRA